MSKEINNTARREAADNLAQALKELVEMCPTEVHPQLGKVQDSIIALIDITDNNWESLLKKSTDLNDKLNNLLNSPIF